MLTNPHLLSSQIGNDTFDGGCDDRCRPEHLVQGLQVLPVRPLQGNGLHSSRRRVQDQGQGCRGCHRKPIG